MWCQNNMDPIPATLKISEKARKYHFLPRKSMLVLRNNSTLNPQKPYWGLGAGGQNDFHQPPASNPSPLRLTSQMTPLNAERFAALMAIQNRLEDHARHKNRGKQVRCQTEAECHREALHRSRAEQEQDDGGDDRRYVGIENRAPRGMEALLN